MKTLNFFAWYFVSEFIEILPKDNQFKLPDIVYIKEEPVYNLKRNTNNRFQKFISEPTIAVKSFAKVKCADKPKLKNFIKLEDKPQEELLQNVEVIIEAVARGDIITTNNSQASEFVGDYTLGFPHKNFEGDKFKDPKNDPNERIYCDLCNETFENGILYCLHSLKHNNNDKYSCHVCKYSTPSEKNIERHVAAHERKTLFTCGICKKGFSSKASAADHKNIHTGAKPYVCDLCGRGFASASVFSNHRRFLHWQMLGLTPFKYDCNICNKSFKGSTIRDRHVNRHHTKDFDESELCDICGKRLSNKESLKFHRRTHTGDKPFPCSVCEKRFPRKEQLKEHMRVHSGEKPYNCKYCNKSFTQRSSVRIHERIHTGERPYVCRFCSKGFTSKGVLDLHLKRCEGVADSSEDSD